MLPEQADVIDAFERAARRHKNMWLRLTPIGLHILYSTESTNRHLTAIIPWQELRNGHIDDIVKREMDNLISKLNGGK